MDGYWYKYYATEGAHGADDFTLTDGYVVVWELIDGDELETLCERYADLKVGDVIEVFILEKVAPTV